MVGALLAFPIIYDDDIKKPLFYLLFILYGYFYIYFTVYLFLALMNKQKRLAYFNPLTWFIVL